MRLEKILEEVTREHVAGHPCKVISVFDKLNIEGFGRLTSLHLERSIRTRLGEEVSLDASDVFSRQPSSTYFAGENISPEGASASAESAGVDGQQGERDTLKALLSEVACSRRVSMTEFRCARPSSFEICEYSEKAMLIERERRNREFRRFGPDGSIIGREEDYEEADDEELRDVMPIFKMPGSYSNFKKGV
jgi:hypothetical protein